MKISYIIVVLICLVLVSSISFAFSGGNGTLANPYLITTCTELMDVNSYLDSNFKIANDINCYTDTHQGGTLWNNGKGFEPIGEWGAPFRGTLDGDYHTVFDLYINITTGKESVGLIEVANGATVKKIGLRNANITGEKKVGGIIGHCENTCQILNSFFDGTVVSTGAVPASYSGGLLGYNASTSGLASLIQNCFVTGTIQANYVGGGLISVLRDSNVFNSYNLAKVSVTGQYSYYSGGIAGSVSASSMRAPLIKNSFTVERAVGYTQNSYSRTNIYCILASGTQNGCTVFDTNVNHYYSSTFPIYNSTPSWNDGNWIWSEGYFPYLSGFTHCAGPIDSKAEIYDKDWMGLKTTDNTINVLTNTNTARTCEWYCSQKYDRNYYMGSGANANTCVPYFTIGSGTLADPWIINNCIDLQNMKVRLDGNYALGNNVDCYADTHQGGTLWNDGNGFYPIGYEISAPFKGSLDGRNKVIYGLYINRGNTINDADYGLYKSTGLIGQGQGCTIKNLGIEDANITGGYVVGGIAGSLTIYNWAEGTDRSTITNSYFKGVVQSIKGSLNRLGMAGGLVGYALKTNISNSYFDGNLKGHYQTGGIVGVPTYYSTIKNTYAKGNIFGDNAENIGGIAGTNGSTCQISNSYNLADINAGQAGVSVGGLAGYNSGSIINSFSVGTITGYLYGGVGQVVGALDPTYGGNVSNLHCLSAQNSTYCTTTPKKSDFYSNTHPVYTTWNDGNWIWTENFFPQLNSFPYCSGPIDSNAEIYATDWTGLKTTDNLTNILVGTNTQRKCEWHCIEGFARGSGADQNTCIETPTYYCSTFSDPNAIVFEGDLDEVPINETQSILLTDINSNTLRKCEYYCNTGYYKGTGVDENRCLPYTCLSPIANAGYHPDDNTGIIKVTETKSIFSVENTQRKCEMKCDTNYVFDGNYCIYNPSSEFKCIGTIPQNAVFWTPDENKNLTKDTQITVSNTNTSEKCEYNCLSGYKKFENNCVPSNWVIGTCSTKTTYFPSESFPEGPLCIEGNPYPINPFFDEDTNIAQWVCTGDYNKACTAKRVGQDMPVVSACSILDLTAEYNYANSEGLIVNTYCSCYTKMNLTFTNYNTGEILAIAPSSVDCNTFLQKQGLGFEQEIVEDMLIQVKGSIKDNVNECTNCEAVTYLSYQLEKESSTIPDNSFICTLLILGIISFILIEKKRI